MKETYEHTQKGWFHYLLIAIGLWTGGASFLFREASEMRVVLLGTGAVFVVLAFMFAKLTVRDEGDRLRIAFGPLPLFGRSIPYDDVEAVESSRSSVIDGWGIHWVPKRGWTYNLAGFDCALLRLKNDRLLRIGTDDREGLVRFLEHKVASRS